MSDLVENPEDSFCRVAPALTLAESLRKSKELCDNIVLTQFTVEPRREKICFAGLPTQTGLYNHRR